MQSCISAFAFPARRLRQRPDTPHRMWTAALPFSTFSVTFVYTFGGTQCFSVNSPRVKTITSKTSAFYSATSSTTKISKRNFGFTRSPTTDNHHFLTSKSLNHWSFRQTIQIRTPCQFSPWKSPCQFWPKSYHMRAKTGLDFCTKMELSFLIVSTQWK